MLSTISMDVPFVIGTIPYINEFCRDIKPENFLLYKENDDSHIKLIDFGLAKKVT
jgi:hypothetical protein